MMYVNTDFLFVLLVTFVTVKASIPNGLDLKLLKALTSDLSKSQAISPFVVSSLMTQVWLGANGTTRDQITPVLGLSGPNDLAFLPAYKKALEDISVSSDNATTGVFNRIYGRNTFTTKRIFTCLLTDFYGADLYKFSSAAKAAHEINTAVAKTTHNRIENLVDEGTLAASQMALVSALYFKGVWLYPFKTSVTGSFLSSFSHTVVEMMSLYTRLEYVEMERFDAVSLPYKDKDYCMLILRPLEKSMEAVKILRNYLDLIDISKIIPELSIRNVQVTMPKFKMSTEYELTEAMESLGIKEIFSKMADFRGISDMPLTVSAIIHKVFIEVDEHGTEAAGAGIVAMSKTSLNVFQKVDFSLDRPFFAILYNKKHEINMFSAFIAHA